MDEKELKQAASDVDALIAKKAYSKADKLIATLPGGVTKTELTARVKAARKARKAPAKRKRPAATVTVAPKMAQPSDILAAYDDLIAVLKKTEDLQRAIGKPFRIYFAHRQRAIAMRLNFVKSMR
jgi:hypothetical protein